MKPATTPIAYTPHLVEWPEGLPEGLAWATRTIFVIRPEGQTQYLVYKPGFNPDNDPRLNEILGSGYNENDTFWSALNSWKLDQKQPSAFWPRLEGCTFTKCVEPGNIALQHVCMSPDGVELARADFRDQAAKLALQKVLHGCTDITFEEYKAVTVTAQVQRGGTVGIEKSYGLLYADNLGQNAVRTFFHAAFRNNLEMQESAATMAMLSSIDASAQSDKLIPTNQKRQPHRDIHDPLLLTAAIRDKNLENSAFQALLLGINKTLLSSNSNVDLGIFQINEKLLFAQVLLHKSSLTPEQALRFAYDNYLLEMERESQGMVEAEQLAPVPAP